MKLVCVGGHLAPLLAVLEVLPKDIEVLVVGRKYALEGDKAESLEFKTIRTLGYQFKAITTGRLQRIPTRHTLLSLFKTPVGFYQALKILKDFKPDVVLCFGGYISLPVSFAALLLQIPIVIHEQTTEAGFANKIIAPFAKKICISWESSLKFFPKDKVVLTGNPIRQFRVKSSELKVVDENIPLIYITGGSSGSHAINILVEGCIKKLLENFSVVHQTGDAREFQDFERLEKLRETLPKKFKERYMLAKFIEPSQVASILSQADLVVSRSGINTVSELMYFGTPCFLIPLNNEQMRNAFLLQKQGLGEIGILEELSSHNMHSKIIEMFKNINTYKKSAVTAKKKVKSDAAEHIIHVLKSVA